ncbi:MAG: CoA pyrophosphatase [Bacteroidetes bacterium]|nr:CoA pyrophosphatase [Bacteroidota bacterium]
MNYNSNFNLFINRLEKLLNAPLPGTEAQFKMAPEGRRQRSQDVFKPESAKDAAVLILLYPRAGEVHFPLIMRQQYKGVHSAQVSLPGGKPEDQDSDLEQTALREAEEEIGVLAESVQILGKLTQIFIPPSNFLVTPFVGFVENAPLIVPQEKEVYEVYETQVQDLLNDELVNSTTLNLANGMRIRTPYFGLHNQTVWGATAMILSEFKELLRQGSAPI